MASLPLRLPKAQLAEKDDENSVLRSKVSALEIALQEAAPAAQTAAAEDAQHTAALQAKDAEIAEQQELLANREKELTLAKQSYDKLKERAKALLASNKQLKVNMTCRYANRKWRHQ